MRMKSDAPACHSYIFAPIPKVREIASPNLTHTAITAQDIVAALIASALSQHAREWMVDSRTV